MGNLAEIRDEELAKEAYDTIINTANHLSASDPVLERELLIYFCYCMFLPNVLRTFHSIMNDKPVVSTSYAQHYQDERSGIEGLLRMLEEEQSTVGEVIPSAVPNAQSVSEHLGTLWRNSVYSAANEMSVDK